MVDVYVKLIINGRRTIEQVPSVIKKEVIQKLMDNGYINEGGEGNG